jgi:hypothetical protein
MASEIQHAERLGIPVEHRTLAGWSERIAPICPHGVNRSFPCLLCNVSTTTTQELPVVTLEEP